MVVDEALAEIVDAGEAVGASAEDEAVAWAAMAATRRNGFL